MLSSNGAYSIILNESIYKIEKDMHISFDLSAISDRCSVSDLNKELHLLFMDNKLVSIEVLSENYMTELGVGVGDSVAKFKQLYPDAIFESSKSLSEDPVTTYYFKTPPNKYGNYYKARVSDLDKNTIDSLSIDNIQYDYDNQCGI